MKKKTSTRVADGDSASPRRLNASSPRFVYDFYEFAECGMDT